MKEFFLHHIWNNNPLKGWLGVFLAAASIAVTIYIYLNPNNMKDKKHAEIDRTTSIRKPFIHVDINTNDSDLSQVLLYGFMKSRKIDKAISKKKSNKECSKVVSDNCFFSSIKIYNKLKYSNDDNRIIAILETSIIYIENGRILENFLENITRGAFTKEAVRGDVITSTMKKINLYTGNEK